MDNEGRLSIVTSNVTLGEHEAGEAPAGDYVRIDVTDNGCGMSPAVLEHAFEPFFTTKPVGKGTGLGLSQIFGFVRQSKGEVTIRSAPGAGTTVSLFLPRLLTSQCAADIRYGQRETEDQLLADGLKDGIVLVVEDDARVRVATIGALEELGYQTLGCGSAEEAIEALRDRYDIGMIITDVVMPGMTGPEMVRKIAPLYPHIAVLFVTGYVGEAGETEQFAKYGARGTILHSGGLTVRSAVLTVLWAHRFRCARARLRRPGPRPASAAAAPGWTGACCRSSPRRHSCAHPAR
jgi:CheY-like chemotaxis protein